MNPRTVEIHLNVTWGSAFMAYKEGDRTRLAWKGDMDLPEDDQHALHIVWGKFQNLEDMVIETVADHLFHESSYKDRSLSCGDVVTIDGRSYACVTLGFRPVEPIVGGEIVGPEGDEALRLAAESEDASKLLSDGIVRMTEDLDRVRKR